MLQMVCIPCAGYLAYPPGSVWLKSNFKKRYGSKPGFRHILQKSKYKKNRPSKVGFCRHLLKMLHPAVPTGFEPAERNWF